MRPFLTLVALLGLLASPAAAAKQCFFSYVEFEKAVPHFDIQTCPGIALAADKGFCRLSLNGDSVRIYRFVFVDKEACLDQVEAMTFTDFVKRFGASYESK